MLAICHHGGIGGRAKILYWWLLHLGQGNPIPWENLKDYAKLIGIHRQNIYRMANELAAEGFAEKIDRNTTTIRAIVPKSVGEDVKQTLDLLKAEIIHQIPPLIAKRRKNSKREPVVLPPEKLYTSGVIVKRAPGKDLQDSPDIRGQHRTLTHENTTLINATYESMRAYLLYGMPGILETDPEKQKLLTPSPLNWRQFRQPGTENLDEESSGIKQWQVTHFIGFYWNCVTWWRSQRKIELNLPNYGRLGRSIKTMMARLTSWQLYVYIDQMTTHFDLLCSMVGQIGDNLIMDEASLTHAALRNVTMQYLSVGGESKDAYYQQYREKIIERNNRYVR